MLRKELLLIFLLLVSRQLFASPPVPALVFQSSMVLPRDKEIPIWGTASPNSMVSVNFAGQKEKAKADANGKWLAKLKPIQASKVPATLTISEGNESLELRDILVGDVWLAAGQSNMEWPLRLEAHAGTELPNANYPRIRFLNLGYAGQNYPTRAFGKDVLDRYNSKDFFRGSWQVCTPMDARNFSAVAYYFAVNLNQKLDIPVGIIQMAVGGSPTESWISSKAMASDPALQPILRGDWVTNPVLDAWCQKRAMENISTGLKANEAPKDENGPLHPFKPSFLWNYGIKGIIPFPIKGAIWYQGESNSLSLPRVLQHEPLFKLLVSDWRKEWNNGDFPFYYCQLSSIGTEKGYQCLHWPQFRDSQRRMATEIPNTGMAVTSDVGHHSDVHPTNKKEVGRRLALCALAKTYQKNVPKGGPEPKTILQKNNSLEISFDNTLEGLKTADGKTPASFEIAGEDDVFFKAEVVLEKGTILLSSTKVRNPVSARYGWKPFSEGNLANSAGLPASTFSLNVRKQ